MANPQTITGFPFEWVDVLNPDEALLNAIALSRGLPRDAVIDCLQPEHLPKHEAYENYHFVILRFADPHSVPDSDNIRQLTRKIALFFNDHYLLTVHRSETPFLNRIATKYAGEPGVKKPYDMVCKIMKNTLETFEEPMVKMDQELDLYESRIFLRKRIPDLLKNLYMIRRKASVFRKLNHIHRMVSDSLRNLSTRNSYMADMRDYLLRLETETDELSDNVNNLLNLYISLSSQKTNEVMRILTVFSAFFLPLTFIVGVYGMNFDYMPELREHYGYPGVLVFMFLVTAIIWQWFKRKRWL